MSAPKAAVEDFVIAALIVRIGAERVPAFASLPVGPMKRVCALSSNTDTITRSAALVVPPEEILRSNSTVLTLPGVTKLGETPVSVPVPPVTSGPDTCVQV